MSYLYANKRKMAKHLNQLRQLNIEKYALELDVTGYTIVPPEVTGMTTEKMEKIRNLLLKKAGEVTGVKWTLEDGPCEEMLWPDGASSLSKHKRSPAKPASSLSDNVDFPHQILLQQLCSYDREFRDLAINPVAVALIEHMIGPNVTRFSSHNSFVKWKGGRTVNLGLHCDQGGIPLPWGRNALTANTNWCLTDYSAEHGPLALVPASHLRHTNPGPQAEREAIPVECKAGSVIIFHGQTWHGAYLKKTNGLRMTIANYYRHMMIQSQEDIQNSFDQELANDCDNPERFRQLAGFEMARSEGVRINPIPYQSQDGAGGYPFPSKI